MADLHIASPEEMALAVQCERERDNQKKISQFLCYIQDRLMRSLRSDGSTCIQIDLTKPILFVEDLQTVERKIDPAIVPSVLELLKQSGWKTDWVGEGKHILQISSARPIKL
ncbi:MAG: hypothetical protein WC525_07575 [Candidatus Thermoplasmatota archaeon]